MAEISSNDRALLADFTRVRLHGRVTHIDVALVTWPKQHEPVLQWTSYRCWQKPPSPERVYDTRVKAIHDSRFFRVCSTCRQRQNRGHMHSKTIPAPKPTSASSIDHFGRSR